MEQILWEQGMNCRNELQQGFKEMNQDKIKTFLQENGADWIG